MLKNMENMQQMMQMVQMLQEVFPSNGDAGSGFPGDSDDSNTEPVFPGGFSGMQTDELMQMAEMMKELFQN